MTTIDNLVSIRELTKEDLPFVLNSSILSLCQYKESIVKGYTKQQAYSYIEKLVMFGLTKMGYSIFIASRKDDSNDIVGYIVADSDNNHIFLQYTKNLYRKLGIQKHLLLPLVIDPDRTITVNWPTKEMLKLVLLERVQVQNKLVESLIERRI